MLWILSSSPHANFGHFPHFCLFCSERFVLMVLFSTFSALDRHDSKQLSRCSSGFISPAADRCGAVCSGTVPLYQNDGGWKTPACGFWMPGSQLSKITLPSFSFRRYGRSVFKTVSHNSRLHRFHFPQSAGRTHEPSLFEQSYRTHLQGLQRTRNGTCNQRWSWASVSPSL